MTRRTITHGILGITGLAMLSGCAVNPSTGRSQLIALPAAQIAYAELGFTLSAAAQSLAASLACARASIETGPSLLGAIGPTCPGTVDRARFALQVERIGAELESHAKLLAPDTFTRIGGFQIGLGNELGAGTLSSAGGRISLDASLAAIEPTDDVVAFLIAREMGHVIARHGEEDSGARIAFSVLTSVVPIGGILVRLVASMLGAQALRASWADAQLREADALALALLERSDRSARVMELNLRIGLKHEHLPKGDWGEQFAQSIERVKNFVLARPVGVGAQFAAVP